MPLEPIIPRRVVVTGIGVITPVGNNKVDFWQNLIHGVGGIGRITKIDPSNFTSQIAGEIKDFDPANYIDKKEARRMDPFCQFAVSASIQAIEDSGIDFDRCDRDRAGVIIGSGIGGMYVYEDQHDAYLKKGPKRISPFFIPMLIADIAAGHISINYNLRGPNYATTSACATSAHALGCAVKAIRYGDADIIVSGGAEAPITAMGLGGFCSMKALSTRNDQPEIACRPFDNERDGFIMAEGAGILLLEEFEHAQARNAHIYAEIAGSGFTADAHHITAPIEDGGGAANSIAAALKDAGIQPGDVEYINAHGTSTPLNDKSETSAIKKIFGQRAYDIPISSTKSMHGHMLGAGGAVEAIATILSIENGVIPPTINYEFPDPDCDLDYTANHAVDKEISVAISNSFGFGGHNATLALKRFS